MRKKYLSALLFGALLVTSAGTFTSCKDYDDDINNLQEQITANADAIKALEELVKAGKYVSGVAIEGQVITFTFSDGSTTPITIPEGEKGQTVEVKDNELYIDGEATGIKVAEAATAETGLVKAENGTWWVLGEDGEYTNTNIPVSGVTVSGSEKDGYTFTIYNEKGEAQTVKLPTASSSITEITLGESVYYNGVLVSDIQPDQRPDNVTIDNFLISSEKFEKFNPSEAVKADGITDASKWPGNKDIPNAGDYIFASPTSVDLRIDPVNVDASNIDFYLTNTKNVDLSPVVLKASASQDSNNGAMTGTNGRAAVTGNGLWTLSMDNVVVDKSDVNSTLEAINDAAGEYVYAINANHGFRSKYGLKANTIAAEDLDNLSITGVAADGEDAEFNGIIIGTDTYKSVDEDATRNITFKTGKAYEVRGVEGSALYDMYLTADKSDTDVYGLTFDQDKHTFTIGKNPDVSSIPAEFDLIIYTVANNGDVEKTKVNITINTEISAAAEYTLQEHSINKDANKNYFGIDLSTMKTALGDNLNQWMQNVDLEKVDYQWSADNITYSEDTPDGFAFDIVEKLVDIPDNDINKVATKATEDRNKANFIQVSINNTETVANTDYLKLGHTYYIKATFKTTDGGILNSIVVPVKFNAPALSAQFVKESAVFKDGGNTAYAYMNYEDQRVNNNTYKDEAVYKLSRAFSDMPDVADEVKLSLDNQTVVVENTQLTSVDVAGFVNEGNNYCSDDIMVELIEDADLPKAQNTNLHVGYGKELTIKATGHVVQDQGYRYKNTRWLYASTEDATYTFQIKVMSPIYEGVVTATDNIITIPATGSAYNLSNNDIKGTTYNNIAYKVLPDKVLAGGGQAWNREEIAGVSAKSNNENVFKVADTPSDAYAYKDNEGKTVIVEGTLAVTPQNIAETTESTMTITVEDCWGYKKPNDIKVKITVGE